MGERLFEGSFVREAVRRGCFRRLYREGHISRGACSEGGIFQGGFQKVAASEINSTPFVFENIFQWKLEYHKLEQHEVAKICNELPLKIGVSNIEVRLPTLIAK